MDIIVLFLVAFLGALAVQTLAFGYSRVLRRVDIIDAAWGLSFIAAIVAMQIFSPSFGSQAVVLIDVLVVIWGARLSWHIFRRFRRSDTQDKRYTEMLENWPKRFMPLQVFVKLFLLQAALATTIILPVVVVHSYQPEMSWIVVIGLIIWLIGFGFESIADRQLRQYLANPGRGDIMSTGLWHYSRHPNYFGEITMWWGVALIACATPLWWLGVIGAATITVLICFVSGVSLAEKRMASRNGWIEYKRRTSALIPWLPTK